MAQLQVKLAELQGMLATADHKLRCELAAMADPATVERSHLEHLVVVKRLFESMAGVAERLRAELPVEQAPAANA